MPVTITVRNVPEAVRDELAARAARSGKSLQAYLLEELTEAASHEDVRTVIGRARERVARTGSRLPADAILSHLDEDRR
jgi:plasmid stability protein